MVGGDPFTEDTWLYSRAEGMRAGPSGRGCALPINETHTSLIGGWDGNQLSNDAHILDWTTLTWTQVSSMHYSRFPYTGGCGVVTDPDSGAREMVVIGGSVTTEIYRTTLRLTIDWRDGPKGKI